MSRHSLPRKVLLAGAIGVSLSLVSPTRAAAPSDSAPAKVGSPPAALPPPAVGGVAGDPIERPQFRTKAHPIVRDLTTGTAMMVRVSSDGTMQGVTSDIIAIVPAESRSGGQTGATFVARQGDVGDEMKTSFDEAVRAVKMRYPRWEPGRIEFSFGEKYTAHDGGSAGTCFAAMLLSTLEGFTIDTKCAVTGDITVDWRVRKIGGVAAKLRGAAADGCLYAGIPADNTAQIGDMLLLNGDASLREIQVFSMATLQDAVALLRTDRTPQLTQAMKEFAELQPKLAAGRAALKKPEIQSALEHVVALAPNHESARWLLQIGRGTAPQKLSVSAALYHILVITYPYREIFAGKTPLTRQTLPPAMTATARKQLAQLRPITPKELAPLLADTTGIVETSESVANRVSPISSLEPKLQSFYNHYKDLRSNDELVAKLLRQGF